MRSPKQVELPPWTAQFVCVAPYLVLSVLATGSVMGIDVPPTLFVPTTCLCWSVTRWVLRVPGADPPPPMIDSK